MKQRFITSAFLAVVLAVPCAAQTENVVAVKSLAELNAVLGLARPGTKISIAPGDYTGGLFMAKVRGTAEKPIVIAGADPEKPPVFKGQGIQLSDAAHVELRDLKITGVTQSNGLNLDDGGTYDTPSHHIVLRNLHIEGIGPKGNYDGIKLSGVDDFRVEHCRIERWGIGSGSGVDMVGCHRGVLENNTFVHSEDPKETGASAVQTKGGCRDIAIRRSRFENAGQRAINIGGSTGLTFFRPPLNQWPAGEDKYEARDVRIEGNTFIGSLAPLAFVGVDGAIARFNTIYLPGRWAMRILQETTEPGFAPSRGGVFTDNVVVFRSDRWFEGGVNIGSKTAPQTFKFARNFWYCQDRPERSRPTLPTPEEDGVYGQQPLFENAAEGNLRLKPDSPARNFGAEAWPEIEKREDGKAGRR